MSGRHRAVQRRNAGPVGVALGMAELGINAGLESFGDEVLQALGFVVQFVELVIEHAVQKCLDQAVVTNDLERPAPARGGKANSTRGFCAAASFCSMFVMEAGATRRRSASALDPTRRPAAPPREKMAFR